MQVVQTPTLFFAREFRQRVWHAQTVPDTVDPVIQDADGFLSNYNGVSAP